MLVKVKEFWVKYKSIESIEAYIYQHTNFFIGNIYFCLEV